MTTKAERETIIRWDDESDMATVYTASERMAKKCATWGWPLGVYSTAEGQPRTWQGEVPKRVVRLAKRKTYESRLGKAPTAALAAIGRLKTPHRTEGNKTEQPPDEN